MPVAARVAAALDRDIRGNRIGPLIGLVRILEGDARPFLAGSDDRDRNPIGRPS